ncbi:MAG: major capsid protein [Lawsonella sp.]
MALTMAQAGAADNAITRGAVEILKEVSNIFDRIPVVEIKGPSYGYREEVALPEAAFRTVNEAYIESTGVIDFSNEPLVILGGEADVDRFLERTLSDDLGSLMAQQVKMKLKAVHSAYANSMFNGDVNVNAKEFDGLRKRLTGSQVIDSATPANTDAFLGELDDLFAQVDGGSPDAVYAPAEVIAKLKTVARKAGGAEYVMSEITGKREFTWNGVPFLDPGMHWSGRRILAVDPTNGGDVYAVKFADSYNDSGCFTITNGGLQVYQVGPELEEKPAYRTRIEFYCGFVVQGKNAAATLTGVKLA